MDWRLDSEILWEVKYVNVNELYFSSVTDSHVFVGIAPLLFSAARLWHS